MSETLARTFIRTLSDSDPAAGTVTFYRRGATVTDSVTIDPYSTDNEIDVIDSGDIIVGDTVSVGVGGASLTIEGVGSTALLVTNGSGSTIPVTAGVRLVVTSRRPLVYPGRNAAASSTHSLDSDDPNGLASGFVAAPSFDYTVTVGESTELHLGAPVGAFRDDHTWIDVRDFADIQDAIDALPSTGGTIYIPAGIYNAATTPSFTGLEISKPVALMGDGGEEGVLSHLVHDVTGSKDIDAISISVRGGCVISNLAIEWPLEIEAGTGRGIRWYQAGSSSEMAGLTLINIVVHRSPNLSFEFACDGADNSFVSKLLMIGCTAYEAKSGGSVFLGGAGTNNNAFEHCEFNGPAFGGFHNVPSCSVGVPSANKCEATSFGSVEVGDEVSGMGIAFGTTVTHVDTGSTPNQITLSANSIDNPTTTLTFYRASGPDTGQLPRGCVHLLRTGVSRFHVCSFQPPSTSPALSTDLVSNDLALRDTYVEKSAESSVVPTFIINGLANLLIDGLYHYSQTKDSMLLKTGPGGLTMGRITNAGLVAQQNPLAGTSVIELTNDGDQLVIDHSMEESSITGATRDIIVTGSGAVLLAIASATTIDLPNGSDEAFRVTGSTAITSITARRPKRRVSLLFTGSAQLTDGSNLKLNGNFSGGADRTITLLCDGTNWFELARSPN